MGAKAPGPDGDRRRLLAHAPAVSAVAAIVAGAAFRLDLALQPTYALASRYLADDYFYFLSVARHLASGHGSTFDGGVSFTNGYQPLFAWLLALTFALGVGHTAAIHAGLVLLIAAGAAASWAAFRLLQEAERPWGGVLAAGVLSLGLFHSLAALSGFETPLALAAVLWTLVLARRGARPAVIGAACGLSVLARVDALPLFALLALRSIRRGQTRELFHMGGVFALFIGPWLLWSLLQFGTVVPDSGAVKARVRESPSIAQAMVVLTTQSARAILPEAMVGPPHRPRRAVVGVGAIVILGLAIAGARRFALAAGYALLLACAYALATDSAETGAFVRYLHPAWAVLAVLVGAARVVQHPVPVMILLLLHGRELKDQVRREGIGHSHLSYVGAALLLAPGVLARVVPEGHRAAAFDAGALGYASDRSVVNLDGLMNHDVVRIQASCAEPLRHCLLSYLREKRIAVLVGGTGFGWTRVFPGWREWPFLYSSPVLRDGDRLVILQVPASNRAP